MRPMLDNNVTRIWTCAAFHLLFLHASTIAFSPQAHPLLLNQLNTSIIYNQSLSTSSSSSSLSTSRTSSSPLKATQQQEQELFEDFASFLELKQNEIIEQIEEMDGSDAKFCRDTWGVFANSNTSTSSSPQQKSGGITRVIQGGNVVEKGACSLTLLRGGKLTAERAAAIRGRQQNNDAEKIKEGDEYYAAALSMVLHTRSPMVPTFRSDVRIFMVNTSSSPSSKNSGGTMAWFGGGADLTPYYLFDEDITFFHEKMKTLCDSHSHQDGELGEHINYDQMKHACDEYFYLPARSEHRGVGGIFFDDMPASKDSLAFVQDVVESWMPSWFPIIEKRQPLGYTEQQRNWQLLRRGRYLEFNLLYDRGVKFGLANANPRVEGVMVSAPPLIAWEYNHEITDGSEEARLMAILKNPNDWVKK